MDVDILWKIICLQIFLITPRNTAWCLLKGSTYLHKPSAFSCLFVEAYMTFLWTPGIKGLIHFLRTDGAKKYGLSFSPFSCKGKMFYENPATNDFADVLVSRYNHIKNF